MPSQYEQLAREALGEITPEKTVGNVVAESTDDDGVITLRFESLLGGYPGWQWNVSLAHVDGYDPTVIEAELLPAAGALLSPDWVPWSERLAEYKAAQEAAGLSEEAAAADGDLDGEPGDDDDDDELDGDDDDELDDDDDDEGDGMSVLHGGDLDGVDIDELDVAGGPEDEAEGPDEIEAEVAAYGAEDTEDDENL